MRILFMGNNKVGYQILNWLKERNENIVGLVLHPSDKRKFGSEILNLFPDTPIFDGSTLRKPEVLKEIQALKADLALSIFFGHILKSECIQLFPQGVINLHPSYLPFNRGQYPNVWSIVEGTPAGVTIHYIDESIDTGDIIHQRLVEVEPTDTGQTLYNKLEQASLSAFQEIWPQLKSGTAPRIPQSLKEGTFHRTKDVKKIDLIDLDSNYKAQDLINILRARTFPPHRGAYFMHNDKKVFVRLELEYED